MSLRARSTVERVRVGAGARVVVTLRNDRVLGLAVFRVVALVVAFVMREAGYRFRIANVAVLLLPRVARVEISLEILRVAHDAVAVCLLVGQRAQRAVVKVVRRSAIVERERLVCVMEALVAADVGEPVRGKRAPAAPRALRPPRGALSAGARHEEHARGGVKL